MGNSYVRQSAADIQTGNIVEADPINAEFNALQSAFDASAGHSHDGTVGEGQKISLTSSIVGVLPVANGGYGGIHNNSASIDPGVTNDSSQGYSVGSVWINTTAKSYFVCTDNTLGAAVWNSFQLVDSALGSIAGLTTTANQTIYTTGSDTYATTSLTAYGRSLIDDADAATARTTLGLGSISTQASSAVSITGGTLSGITLSGSTISSTTITGGSISTLSSPLSVLDGGTGTSSLSTFKTNLSLNNVDNTSDLNKPISTATQTALNLKADSSTVTSSLALKLDRSGGTMTGSLVLNADPSVALGATTKQYVDNLLVSAVPSGTIIQVAMSTAPSGYIKANGAAVSRTTYSALFAAIGTTYGAGDGSTTFNLPDLRGEFIRGLDDGRGVDGSRVLGSAQSSQNLSHTHTGTTSTDPGHTHTYPTGGVVGGGYPTLSNGFGSNASTNSAGSHNHTFTTNADGGTEARPRNIALLYCIKF